MDLESEAQKCKDAGTFCEAKAATWQKPKITGTEHNSCIFLNFYLPDVEILTDLTDRFR